MSITKSYLNVINHKAVSRAWQIAQATRMIAVTTPESLSFQSYIDSTTWTSPPSNDANTTGLPFFHLRIGSGADTVV